MKLINFRNYMFRNLIAAGRPNNNHLVLALFEEQLPQDLVGYKTYWDIVSKAKHTMLRSFMSEPSGNNSVINDKLILNFGLGSSRTDVFKQCFDGSGANIAFPTDFYVHRPIGLNGNNQSGGEAAVPATRPGALLTAASDLPSFYNALIWQGRGEANGNFIYAGYRNDGYYMSGTARRYDFGTQKPIDFIIIRGTNYNVNNRHLLKLWYIPEGQSNFIRMRGDITVFILNQYYTMIQFPRVQAREVAVQITPERGVGVYAQAWTMYVSSIGFGALEVPTYQSGLVFSVDGSDRNNISRYAILNQSQIQYSAGDFKVKVGLDVVGDI